MPARVTDKPYLPIERSPSQQRLPSNIGELWIEEEDTRQEMGNQQGPKAVLAGNQSTPREPQGTRKRRQIDMKQRNPQKRVDDQDDQAILFILLSRREREGDAQWELSNMLYQQEASTSAIICGSDPLRRPPLANGTVSAGREGSLKDLVTDSEAYGRPKPQQNAQDRTIRAPENGKKLRQKPPSTLVHPLTRNGENPLLNGLEKKVSWLNDFNNRKAPIDPLLLSNGGFPVAYENETPDGSSLGRYFKNYQMPKGLLPTMAFQNPQNGMYLTLRECNLL